MKYKLPGKSGLKVSELALGAMRGRDINAAGNSRKNMMDSVHASLKRLNTDYIDLYWVHAWDPLTPVEEIMRGQAEERAHRVINHRERMTGQIT